MTSFGDAIQRAVIAAYDALPPLGKPRVDQPSHWVLLAAFVAVEQASDAVAVLALGTGSKCVGDAHVRPDGGQVTDCHAEVLARRALVRWLQAEVHRVRHVHQPSRWLTAAPDNATMLTWRSDVSLVLYVSHAPCGDASIFVSDSHAQRIGGGDCSSASPPTKRARLTRESDDRRTPSTESDGRQITATGSDGQQFNVVIGSDIQRTGAKPVPGEQPDRQQPGLGYHALGSLRRKPGRGPVSSSHACSDKLARWSVLGVQGALLTRWLRPVYLTDLVVADVFDADALDRAVNRRSAAAVASITSTILPAPYAQTPVRIHASSACVWPRSKVLLERRFGMQHVQPAPAALVWWRGIASDAVRAAEASKGVRLGTTRRNALRCSARMAVSRSIILAEHLRLCRASGIAAASSVLPDDASAYNAVTYAQAKAAATGYQDAWRALLTSGVFANWQRQPAARSAWNNQLWLDRLEAESSGARGSA